MASIASSAHPAQPASPSSRNGQTTKPSSPPRTSLFDDDDDDDESPSLFTTDPETISIPDEEVTSPASISSPPYWVQSHPHSHNHHLRRPAQGNSHARGLSTASVESVLPPGAITLQDNESETQPHSPGTDRNRACWAKSVQVVDYVHVNGSTTNLGAFTVWNIKVETLTGSKINIRKRYSEFDDLRHKLVQTFPNFEAAVPVLPPKSVLNKFKPKFLEKRRAGLQYFLNCILLNPEFSGSPVLKEFLFS
ncbi:PX domain-containing protein YPT35 [Podospora australis]|uniref:Endosomal/vacuolar adapter protein YPT35 n=1 Tax=Podospora australis TaxID=1536484 RepID=A0AAN6X0Q9_9PEZI|nr:PX domain-containing protein YPT35 [Podospora australis]